MGGDGPIDITTPPFQLPDYACIKRVHSFDELVSTRFQHGVNALCWQRSLQGDFAEVARSLKVGEGITTLEDEQLLSLDVSPAGRAAIAVLLEDLRLLREHDLQPNLDCINGYLRDADPGPVPTDVYSFHVDSATVEADTYLCTYFGETSEGLRNEDALRRVDVPETRAALLKLYGGEDDASFLEFLSDNCFDLHYVSKLGAAPYTFGVGNLWRIACQYPDSPAPPCIHRAPETPPGRLRRLLLIS